MTREREKTVKVGMRLPVSLVARVDQHADRLGVAAPDWLSPDMGRTAAVKDLLAAGLDVREREAAS